MSQNKAKLDSSLVTDEELALISEALFLSLDEFEADIDLEAHGIDIEQAKTLRNDLATFSNDWDIPEMRIYDDYDAAKFND